MDKINLLELIDDNWYVDIDKNILNKLIEKSKEKLGSLRAVSEYFKINISTISRWQGKVKNKNTKPSYKNIKKLAELGNTPIDKDITGIKLNSGHNFLSLTSLKLSQELIRSVAFIIGDGDIGKRRVRFANSNKLAIKSILSDISKIFNLKNPWIKLTYPRNSKKSKIIESVKEWETYLGYKINGVYEKHNTKIRGKPFKSKKEYVEVSFHSSTLSEIIIRILPILRKEIMLNKSLSIAYLQGIYAAEGSITSREKNKLRVIQLNMKDKNEIIYIKKVLNLLNIRNSGERFDLGNNAWYINITGRKEIETCLDMDIFKINSERKIKLEKVINNYERYQVTPVKNKERFLQITSILNDGTFNSLQVSNALNMSLIRTQVLLKKGFDKGKWNRIWNGSEFIYEKD